MTDHAEGTQPDGTGSITEGPAHVNNGVAVARLLVAAGVQRVYAVPGESFLEILDAAEHDPGLELVSTRHESSAAFMAEAEAKLTGRLAVAAATRGVGAANLAIGVHTAQQDSTPLLVLVGQVSTGDLGKEAFQEVDLTAFFAPITKWSTTVQRADRLPDVIARAIRIARSGRPGPVMVAVPSDVLAQDVPEPLVADAAKTVRMSHRVGRPDAPDVEAVRQAIDGAALPVVIAGGGAQEAREQLVAFAEAYDIGVYASFRRQDVFPNDHPLYLGHLGLGTPPATLEALRSADLVCVLGSRLSEVTTQGYTLPSSSATIVHVDVEPTVVGATVGADIGLVADVRQTLEQLLTAPSRHPDRDWRDHHDAYVDSSTPAVRDDARGVDPGAVIEAMRQVLAPDCIITNDAGNFSAFLHRYWRYCHPRTQVAPTSGAMGYGVPAAVASALSCRDRSVVCLVGDGGLLMTGAELETAVRYGAQMCVIVFKNGLYGTIAMHQLRELGRTSGTGIGALDLVKYAESLGALGIRVDANRDVADALARAQAHRGVSLVEIVSDPRILSPSTFVDGAEWTTPGLPDEQEPVPNQPPERLSEGTENGPTAR